MENDIVEMEGVNIYYLNDQYLYDGLYHDENNDWELNQWNSDGKGNANLLGNITITNNKISAPQSELFS